jgi:hypothetical protein
MRLTLPDAVPAGFQTRQFAAGFLFKNGVFAPDRKRGAHKRRPLFGTTRVIFVG